MLVVILSVMVGTFPPPQPLLEEELPLLYEPEEPPQPLLTEEPPPLSEPEEPPQPPLKLFIFLRQEKLLAYYG
jgi:hypothetical protein